MIYQGYTPVSDPQAYSSTKSPRPSSMRLRKIYRCLQGVEIPCTIISIGVLSISGTLVSGYDLPPALSAGLVISLITASVQLIRGFGCLFTYPRPRTDARVSQTFLVWLSFTTVMWVACCILLFVGQASIDGKDDIKHEKRDWRNGAKIYVPGTAAQRVKAACLANGALAAALFLINMLQWFWVHKLYTSYFAPWEISEVARGDENENNNS